MGADEVFFKNHDALVRLGALGKPVEVRSNKRFDWVAPVPNVVFRPPLTREPEVNNVLPGARILVRPSRTETRTLNR